MFNIIYFTEQVAPVVASDFVALGQICRAIFASETMCVEQRITNFSSFVGFEKNFIARRTSWSEHPVEVLPTVELSKF